MFTGLVETLGKICEITKEKGGAFFSIEADFENNDLKNGDSVSVNGACQTVISLSDDRRIFRIYSSFKTLELTNFSSLKMGEKVNLERAMLPTSRMGGHIVQGHVDGIGRILSRKSSEDGLSEIFIVEIPKPLSLYAVSRGSITVDGISLTVVEAEENRVHLVLIPETVRKTNASEWKAGKEVNIETDILARYAEKFILKDRNTL